MNRIDNLRTLVAKIGERQTEYLTFFPTFADRLVSALGDYLSDASSVALSCAYGEFTFDNGSYGHAALGFENGKYRIPLMFRLRNFQDSGVSLVRVRVCFTKDGAKLSAQISGESALEIDETDFARLNEYIYSYLCKSLAVATWFEQNKSDYQGTGIGFG